MQQVLASVLPDGDDEAGELVMMLEDLQDVKLKKGTNARGSLGGRAWNSLGNNRFTQR